MGKNRNKTAKGATFKRLKRKGDFAVIFYFLSYFI